MARYKSAGVAKPRNDAYTMMLLITFVATVAGCILLYLDYEDYGKEQPQVAPALTLPPLVAQTQPGAQAPAAPAPDTRNVQAPVAPVAPVPPADAVSVSRRVVDARPVSRVVNPGALLLVAIPTSATVPVGTVIPPDAPAAKPVARPGLDVPAVVVPPIK